jgi:hypothetical protein
MSNSYQLGRKGEAEAISKFSAGVNVPRSSCCAQSMGIYNIKTNKVDLVMGIILNINIKNQAII